MKKSFFEPDDRPLTGDDLLWLYNHDKLVIVDYPVTNAISEQSVVSKSHIQKLISARDTHYVDFINQSLDIADHFASIEKEGDADELAPFWNNGWFPSLDGISLATILKQKNPRRYIEVGSGNSTKFAAAAIASFGLRTEIISIDPHPRAEIDNICKEIVRMPLENVDFDTEFGDITEDDVFLLDSSHRAYRNSDVTVFFVNILPNLKAGCVYGVHDIFLPGDYPLNFVNRYYNEQYMLQAYLLGGAAGDKILFPAAYIATNKWTFYKQLGELWRRGKLDGLPVWGGAFWMTKG
ncbi:UNVERIFIED_CONTAM: class I SAM-dependent methyltransferase [Methylobacteriaceae bacterium AG10]|nr:class I SAM-dependent methyltransferase [Methylobacteriaceae bacterium AG10]